MRLAGRGPLPVWMDTVPMFVHKCTKKKTEAMMLLPEGRRARSGIARSSKLGD